MTEISYYTESSRPQEGFHSQTQSFHVTESQHSTGGFPLQTQGYHFTQSQDSTGGLPLQTRGYHSTQHRRVPTPNTELHVSYYIEAHNTRGTPLYTGLSYYTEATQYRRTTLQNQGYCITYCMGIRLQKELSYSVLGSEHRGHPTPNTWQSYYTEQVLPLI